MKRNDTVVALALALLLPIGVQASDLSYNWIEADYIDAGDDIDGWGVRGQFRFGESGLYGLGGYTDIGTDTPVGRVDLTGWEAGLGYAHSLSQSTDLIGEASYLDIENYDGWRVSAGVRSGFTPRFEGILKANYVDLDCGFCDSDVTGTAGLQYKFTPALGLVGEVEFGNGDETWLLGMRASF